MKTELGRIAEKRHEEKICESMNHYSSVKIVEKRRKRENPVAARTAEECVEIQEKVFSESYKQNETKEDPSEKDLLSKNVGVDHFTIYFPSKR